MSIAVICPGCKASFRVNDKFAGKQGPCPKCKTVIQIPEKTGDVEVHAPEEYAAGGKDSKGRPVSKPIPRAEKKVGPLVLTVGIGGAVLVLAATWMLGSVLRRAPGLGVIGLLLISPPIALVGYSFIRDDELAPHRGKSVWIRSIICGLVYVALWVGFSFVPPEYRTEMWNWFYVAPPFVILGALAGLACFDLDFGSGFLHYAFYVFLTSFLRYLAGMGWPWDIVKKSAAMLIP